MVINTLQYDARYTQRQIIRVTLYCTNLSHMLVKEILHFSNTLQVGLPSVGNIINSNIIQYGGGDDDDIDNKYKSTCFHEKT